MRVATLNGMIWSDVIWVSPSLVHDWYTIDPLFGSALVHRIWVIFGSPPVVTKDGKRCAQAEHTLLITEDGAEILTQLEQ